jgi:hypothetical protein
MSKSDYFVSIEDFNLIPRRISAKAGVFTSISDGEETGEARRKDRARRARPGGSTKDPEYKGTGPVRIP